MLLEEIHLTGKLFSGDWREAHHAVDAREPATGAVIGKIGFAGGDEVRQSAARARLAHSDWASGAPDVRAAVVAQVAQLATAHAEEIIVWIMRESGSVRPKAEFELGITIKALQLASAMPNQAQGLVLPSEAGRLSLARRRPLGVVGVISPFNFPLYLAMRAVAPALAVGNAVVLKPDPRTAVCGGYVIARLFELAGLPSGLLAVVPGDHEVGEALCEDPNVAMIQFTGSTNAGRAVGQLASKNLKKVSLELGGKNSLIVLEDADIDLAVKNAAWGAWLHQGQICMTAGRIFVHASIIDKFAALLAEKASQLPAGDPMTGAVALGPLISLRQCEHAKKILDDSVAAGAELLIGGEVNGLVMQPAVLKGVGEQMAAYREEIFGPVAVLIPFENDDDAVRMANDTEYGLAAAVISNNVARAMSMGESLHAGLIHINDQTVNDDVVNPFGGVGASGNGTSIGGPANWEAFTHWQWITVKSAPPAYPF